jgi:hypothetical protein
MEEDDLDILIAVEELGLVGLWNSVRDVSASFHEFHDGSEHGRVNFVLQHALNVLRFMEKRPLCLSCPPQIFESRLPLQRVTLTNKAGRTTLVDRLPARFVVRIWSYVW